MVEPRRPAKGLKQHQLPRSGSCHSLTFLVDRTNTMTSSQVSNLSSDDLEFQDRPQPKTESCDSSPGRSLEGSFAGSWPRMS